MPSYWLMKSEPDECSISDVANAPGHRVPWIGVSDPAQPSGLHVDVKHLATTPVTPQKWRAVLAALVELGAESDIGKLVAGLVPA